MSTDAKEGRVQLTQSRSFLHVDCFESAWKMAEAISISSLIPDSYRGKAADIVVAWAYGAEVGLSPMQSLQSVAVIRGKPVIWGDGLLALVQAHPDCEWIHEEGDESGYTCKVKRRGYPELKSTFTQEDARRAGLWGKNGPWRDYPARMLQMRARGFALRDAFANALKGIKTAEEVLDYRDDFKEVKIARVQQTTAAPVVSISERKERIQAAAETRMSDKPVPVYKGRSEPQMSQPLLPSASPEVHSTSEDDARVQEAIDVVKEAIPGAETMPGDIQYEDWLWKVNHATDEEELSLLAEEAKKLPEDRKTRAREHFSSARQKLKNKAETEEKAEAQEG